MWSLKSSGDRLTRLTPATRITWIFGAGPDLLIALCWVPLWLVGHHLSGAHGAHNDALLRSAVALVFLVSFLHQPVTFGLVYGDANQFRQRRRLFLWAPPAALATIVLSVTLHLWVIIPVAALWNTVHTLQQRYGLSRIYGRKAGYGSARLDRGVLYAAMVAAALAVAASPATPGLIDRVGLEGVNASGVRLLSDLRPWAVALLVPTVLLSVGLAGAIVRQELAQMARGGRRAPAAGTPDSNGAAPPANPAKWLYQASSVALIASIALDPVAGFMAYVGAHAIEYFVVAYKTTETRYQAGADRATVLGRLARRTPGRVACFAAIMGVALAAHARLTGDTSDVVLYTVGALHFLFDSYIWKLRRPAVAADFAIAAA